MCSRILNALLPSFPVTGRNMNWFGPIQTRLYSQPRSVQKRGLSEEFIASQKMDIEQAFTWTSQYASVSSVMLGLHVDEEHRQPSSDKPYQPYVGEEYATADGLNEKGLAVNALADVDCQYGSTTASDNLISTLRWAQYVLDCFATVKDAVEVLRSPPYRVINQGMPDSSGKSGIFHLCLSDSSGDSAIVEYVDGQPAVYHSREYTVAANQPSYASQLILNDYWQYQWGATAKPKNHTPVSTAPGGFSSTQLFERASFLLTFSVPQTSEVLSSAQTRTLMLANAVPLIFNKHALEPDYGSAPYTTWTNVIEHQAGRYIFINSFTMNTVYLDVDASIEQGGWVDVMSAEPETQGQFAQQLGDQCQQLTPTDKIPFEI